MMATVRKIGGYTWKQQISTGRQAIRRARLSLERLPTSEHAISISLALLEINEVFVELAKIGRRYDRYNHRQKNDTNDPPRSVRASDAGHRGAGRGRYAPW